MALLAILGFASGLPLLLTGQTLAAWMTAEGVSLKSIGAFAAVGLPYTFKWAWAPLLDRYRLPWLGRRRGWIVLFQLLLGVAIAAMGTVDPVGAPLELALLAVTVAALSASHDVVLDAYTTDLLTPAERAAGSAVYVMGYRVAMLVTGTAALVLADHLPWRFIYWALAAVMLLAPIATVLAEEPAAPRERPSFVQPFVSLFKLERIAVVLAFVALYKFGDYLSDTMRIPFLRRELGFAFTEIALINKVLGFAGVIAGGVAAGVLTVRLGLKRALLLFGVGQAATNLCFAGLALAGKSTLVLAVAVLVDNLANAMGAAAFAAFLMSLCDVRTSATQFALLTSLSSMGGRVFGFSAAHVVGAVGWPWFWAFTAIVAIPGLALSLFLPGPPPGGDKKPHTTPEREETRPGLVSPVGSVSI